MPNFYDWAQDEKVNVGQTAHGELVPRPTARVNAVTGHGLDCQCPKCPGWYDARAELTRPTNVSVPAPRAAKPLADVVLPVSVLMAVFTLCAVVLLPVVMPFVALGALSLGLIAVSICVVTVVALSIVLVLRRTSREVLSASRASRGRVVRGRVL